MIKPKNKTVTTIVPLEKNQPVNYIGTFTVVHKTGITKFDILDLAMKFFNELHDDAAVWDVTCDAELITYYVAGEEKDY